MTPYQSILIIGGGTAGWLAAAYLQRTLGANPHNPVSITLIESKDIGVIGVGEATVPTLRQTLRVLDIPETALFAHAEATLKNGIRFVGWRTGGDASTDRYDHPFESTISMEGYGAMTHWLNLKQRGLITEPFADVGGVQTALFDGNRSPKLMQSPNYEAPIAYAYHLDAVMLGGLLRDVATSRGVHHITGKVVHVERDDSGIKSVTLEDGTIHAADLFVDCSGFRSLLLGDALDVPWVSYSDTLLCDRAVACPVAYEDENVPLRSYTTATAKDAGWVWEIDLQSRRGTGYVYSSGFCDEAQAEATLRAHNGDANMLADMRHLKMNVGHRARVWEKNCLSLGLASGFIEPLESTGIYLVEHAIQLFLDYLPVPGTAGTNQKKYNALMADLYDELRDFIVLHYMLTQRKDTAFWRAYSQDVVPPASLAALLEIWDEKIPGGTDINRRLSLFGPHNWFYILAGMHRLPSRGIAQTNYLDPEISKKVLAYVANTRNAALSQSPTMRDYAKKIRAAVGNAPMPGRL
jgi:2-polyprenyl-6-methoxyphenol hydroxylase-like FAD-dependent oxidoreductase